MRSSLPLDALCGLAPTASVQCVRCSHPTLSLANGRGRVDICETCGTLEILSVDGLEVFRLHDPNRSRALGAPTATAASVSRLAGAASTREALYRRLRRKA